MDAEQLHVILQQSFSADANVRKPAEETIRNLKHVPGTTQLLLQVAAEKQVRDLWKYLVYLRLAGKDHNVVGLLFFAGERTRTYNCSNIFSTFRFVLR